MDYGSLPLRFLKAVDEHPSPRAQMVRRDEHWEAISSKEYLRRVAGLANAFVELGVKPGDRVGLFAPNCPEWHTADFAISGSGARDRACVLQRVAGADDIHPEPLRGAGGVHFRRQPVGKISESARVAEGSAACGCSECRRRDAGGISALRDFNCDDGRRRRLRNTG